MRDLPDDAPQPAAHEPARRPWSWIVTALGVLCIVWGALHLADASLQGSGRTFETRPRYDDAKRRTHAALPGALGRCALGLGLLAAGARLRRSKHASP